MALVAWPRVSARPGSQVTRQTSGPSGLKLASGSSTALCRVSGLRISLPVIVSAIAQPSLIGSR